jgi:hypothetical protein
LIFYRHLFKRSFTIFFPHERIFLLFISAITPVKGIKQINVRQIVTIAGTSVIHHRLASPWRACLALAGIPVSQAIMSVHIFALNY